MPHGYDTATPPTHPQPVKAMGDNVGNLVGANAVGAQVVDAVGGTVGAAVGFDGQFVMPCRKAHKALASMRCCNVG